MALGKSIMVALVLLVLSLISYCPRMANGQIDGGGIGTCNQNCTFYDNGTSSPCNGNCSCISDKYDYLREPQNPAGPGKCYATQISPKVANGYP
uniref:8 kDa Amblyomma family member n=1 Tax=Rhipicephalus zambeziensis TaxID=60191 RepID=A0A224YBV6_9ACAR